MKHPEGAYAWTIPVVQLQEAEAGERLLQALEEVGFACLLGVEGAARQAWRGMLAAARTFFGQMTPQDKQRWRRGGMEAAAAADSNAGYVGLASEALDEASGERDSKEAFNLTYDAVSRELESSLPAYLVLAKREFDAHVLQGMARRVLRQLAEAMRARGWHRVAAQLLAAHGLADGDGDNEAFIVRDSLTTLRLLHYPPMWLRVSGSADRPTDDVDAAVRVRAGAHTDYGTCTLLVHDGTPGLQVHHDGRWWTVREPCPGAGDLPVLLNVGDLLQHWTGGRLRSTVHRVVAEASCANGGRSMEGWAGASGLSDAMHPEVPSADAPPRDAPQTGLVAERFSVALFIHPADDTVIDGREAVLAAQWVRQRFAASYAADASTASPTAIE
ncbi:hypothetical protein CDCA_CDCA10G3054 [Cyanidium caldarium]|uniref:Fe2OG dioxygenase domain-containing protein n=1 Tax=Cyanidium caldarium TaxID=2771 RepID=A0AAV9IXP1_CYACA|nr:hypothetical protein CDCA_CDCA10G3054 [Cyanidium caldarium]